MKSLQCIIRGTSRTRTNTPQTLRSYGTSEHEEVCLNIRAPEGICREGNTTGNSSARPVYYAGFAVCRSFPSITGARARRPGPATSPFSTDAYSTCDKISEQRSKAHRTPNLHSHTATLGAQALKACLIQAPQIQQPEKPETQYP